MCQIRGLIYFCIGLAICAASGKGSLFAAQTQVVFAQFGGVLDAPEMQIANADGSNIRAVLPPNPVPKVLGLAVDPRDQTIYYGRHSPNYEIARVRIDGTGNTTLYSLTALDPLVFNLPNATPSPYGISVDTVHNKIYWIGGQNNSGGFAPNIPTFIQRANLDGSNVEIVRQTPWTSGSPFSLVVDGASGKLYWTDMVDYSIRVANLDGSDMRRLLRRGTSGLPEPLPWRLGGLAIDFQHQIMFWSELTSDNKNTNIMSANLDGSEVKNVHTIGGAQSWFGMPNIIGIAVDPASSKLYFAKSGGATGTIYRSNYDGSNFQILIDNTPQPFAIGLLLVPEPSNVILVLWALGILTFMTRPWNFRRMGSPRSRNRSDSRERRN